MTAGRNDVKVHSSPTHKPVSLQLSTF